MHIRHIPLPHAFNLRDLGGYQAEGGTITKWNRLYRSDSLSTSTEEEWDTIQSLHIRKILDFRSQQERTGDPVHAPEGIEYMAFPLMKELDEQPALSFDDTNEEDTKAQILKSMELNYANTFFGNLPCVVSILSTILESLKGEDALLFMCSAGKDRTGIIAATILYLCGVSREDIIADYMVSGQYNEKGVNQAFKNLPDDVKKHLPDWSLLKKSFDSDPETMADLLTAFEEKDVRTCLAEAGFSRDKQTELSTLFRT